MRYPPRLAHLATRKVIAAKLAPGFAQMHFVDEEEAHVRLDRALQGALLEDLLEATWTALQDASKRFNETKTLERIFETLRERPMRPGRVREPTAAMGAFYLALDIEAGTASDAARRRMETPQGRELAKAGLAEAGRYLAAELTRGA